MQTKTGNCKKGYRCKICFKKILGSKYRLNVHLYQHGALSPKFQCSYCPRQYYRRDTYKRHMLIHDNKRRLYFCDHCERGFIDKRNLVHHIAIHYDIFFNARPKHNCTPCGTSYSEKRVLERHIRKIHFNMDAKEPNFVKKKVNETWIENVQGSKLYVEMTKVNNNVLQITKCENMMIKVENLQEKDKVMLNKYATSIYKYNNDTQYSKVVCDYCKKEMVKKSIKKHIWERHLKIRQFKCEQCSEYFNRHYQMVNHICGKYKRKERKY